MTKKHSKEEKSNKLEEVSQNGYLWEIKGIV